jgi:hypothetical protein
MLKQKQTKVERKEKEREEVVKQTNWPADKCQRVVQRQD